MTKNSQQPHTVQQIMSKQATPLLSGAIPSLEMFIKFPYKNCLRTKSIFLDSIIGNFIGNFMYSTGF